MASRVVEFAHPDGATLSFKVVLGGQSGGMGVKFRSRGWIRSRAVLQLNNVQRANLCGLFQDLLNAPRAYKPEPFVLPNQAGSIVLERGRDGQIFLDVISPGPAGAFTTSFDISMQDVKVLVAHLEAS